MVFEKTIRCPSKVGVKGLSPCPARAVVGGGPTDYAEPGRAVATGSLTVVLIEPAVIQSAGGHDMADFEPTLVGIKPILFLERGA